MGMADVADRLRERVRDRARAATFARFLWRRFLDDNLFQAAGSLAYTTAFALVPLAVVVLGVLSAFPVFQDISGQLVDYVLSNFVPSAAEAIEERIDRLSENTKQLTAAGTVALVVSLLVTLHSVESTFNRIWRVASARPRLSRYLVYWTVLTLGALLAAASLSVSTRFFALPLFETPQGRWLANLSLGMTPVLIELAVVVLAYRVVPHHTVKWRHALAGAVLAVVLLEGVKAALGLYLGSFEGYQKLYGALAFVPVPRLFFNSSLNLQRICDWQDQALLQEFLCRLDEIRLVRRDERGEWLLARDLDTLTLAELYEACQLRVPIEEAWLPCHDDTLGAAVQAVLDDLRLPLRDALKRRVGDIFLQTDERTGA